MQLPIARNLLYMNKVRKEIWSYTLGRPVALFLLWTLAGVLGKLLFLCFDVSGASLGDWWDVVRHGLRLDLAVAAYFTVLPMLLFIAEVWLTRSLRRVWQGVLFVESLAVAMATMSNIALYPYWGFPLDTTSLFYLATSPGDAMASVAWWQMLVGVLSVSGTTYLLYKGTMICCGQLPKWCSMIFKMTQHDFQNDAASFPKRRYGISLALVLLAASLFIPIRGGFGVATNNVGSVYYSQRMVLNHAAVNPVFSFLESATHSDDFASMYRFMDDTKAQAIFAELSYTALRSDAGVTVAQALNDSTAVSDVHLRRTEGVNVLVVILESFSRYIMADGGHVQGVTPCLDRLSQEGIYFDRFYANSFRTDRGLVSILSAFPAQPTVSLMKYSHKTSHLYSMANTLSRHGYATQYYYGGNANFTNMRSYLMQTGFNNIISEDDFPSQRTGKWGVDDEWVFQKALQDIKDESQSTGPWLKVVQTSSSHEPFDVPYQSGQPNKVLNAFAYTDHCLEQFISQLKRLPQWQNTLVVLVPDHLGGYPETLDNYQVWRYEIPLVMVGGVVDAPHRVSTIGSQVDICATLFGLLGIDHSEFPYSKDLLDARAPHFAFFTCPDMMGFVDERNAVIYDNVGGMSIVDEGEEKGRNLPKAQAYLQKMFDDIANMK